MAKLAWTSFMVLPMLFAGLGAQAQQKPKAPKQAAPVAESKPTEDPKAPEKKGASEASQPAAEGEPAPANEDDLGDPPPAVEAKAEKVRPSPLTPRPNEFPQGQAKPAPPEYDRLLSDIAALRSRVAALTTTLFKSKLRIIVRTDGDNARIHSFVVTLDDGVVFSASERFVADDERTVYEHAVAPGHHVVGVEVERTDARGKEYTTWQTSKFSVVVPDSQLLETEMLVEDDSDMAEDFPEDGDGQYDVRVRLRARVAEQ